jgi:hypothetical protein
VGRARSLAVEQDAEGDRRARPGEEDEMRVAGVEAVGDAPAGVVERDLLAADRPLAGQRPLVEAQALGELVGAPPGDAKDSPRP